MSDNHGKIESHRSAQTALAKRRLSLEAELAGVRRATEVEVKAARADGQSVQDIAEHLGLTRQGVYWILDSHGKTEAQAQTAPGSLDAIR